MKIFRIITGSALIMTVISCSMWEPKPTNEWDEKYVWSVSEMAAGVLGNAYAAIPAVPDSYGNNFLDAATDNATSTQKASSAVRLASGEMSIGNNPIGIWESGYKQLQYVNSFLENGLTDATRYDKVDSDVDAAYKKRLYGEAHFLRAWWMFQLLQQYGGKTDDGLALGIPMADHFFKEAEVSNMQDIKRASYEECAMLIMDDCDKAIANLPAVYTGTDVVEGVQNVGMATSLAAAALKSRVALYAASPAYQDDKVTKIKGMGDFSVVDDAAYLKNWERAALIANEVFNMTGFGVEYHALKGNELADAPNATPAEFLFRFYRNTHALEQRHFPPYYFGQACTVPSQNLVDAFPAANGFPISDARSNYDPENPYMGRDQRLEMVVYHHGQVFGNSGMPINVMAGGKDSHTYNDYGSVTGYYLAKFLSRKQGILTPGATSTSQHYWAPLRRAEVFLNYAEAANEAWGPNGKGAGCTYSAYDIIKEIRSASGGITSTTYLDEAAAAGKDAFRQLIANERRLELAFENQRYYDLRRTLSRLDEEVRGVEVSIKDGKLTYDTEKVVAKRPFTEVRNYYFPLPYDETVKNSNIVNNKGWN